MGETFLKLAAENLSQRSSERDDEFDRFVDRVEGPILIRGQEISASNALYSDVVAYRASLLEFRGEQRAELIERVVSEFPHPIAYCFHRYEYAADDPNKKFQFLKDVWESTIALLFALVLGEARARRVSGIVGTKCEYVQSQNNRDRLDVIEKILAHDGQRLGLSGVIDSSTIRQIVDLNALRNEEFAHLATLNEEQSQRLVEEVEPSVLEILRGMEGLSEVELLRYLGPSRTRGKHRVETFCGESGSRRIEERAFVPEHVAIFSQRGFSRDDVYALHGGSLYVVSPIICCREAVRGHRTELSFFKKFRAVDGVRELIFEVFGTSDEYRKIAPELLSDFDELKSMYAAKKVGKKS